MFDLTGKVCVVTGGSRGMGKEMVLAFARAGADVVIASRKLENCERLALQVEAETGRQALPIAAHVGYWDQCETLVKATLERFGRLDVLVNNAGMSPLYPSLVEVGEDLYDKVMAVNLKGPFRLSALAGDHMKNNGGGSIINVSSISSIRPTPHETVYAGAKAGLNAITEAFAKAYGPEVRVNCIMPGPFLTDISTAWNMDAFNERAATEIAMRRGGEADEVVGAALYFASDASSYTTGSILKIDGGTT
ncbi:MAG: glucose 1-dehydrogenase [Actinomycetia bacterium]|nr:glucose 1-dehydrogenase [Actinomycetes bacterium]